MRAIAYNQYRNMETGTIDERSLRLGGITLSYGPHTVRTRGVHKIARNVVQIVFKSRCYLAIAYPVEWQGE